MGILDKIPFLAATALPSALGANVTILSLYPSDGATEVQPGVAPRITVDGLMSTAAVSDDLPKIKITCEANCGDDNGSTQEIAYSDLNRMFKSDTSTLIVMPRPAIQGGNRLYSIEVPFNYIGNICLRY